MTATTRGRNPGVTTKGRSKLPEQRVVLHRQPAAEVRRAARTTCAGLRADHPLDHDDVAGPPAGGELVVLEHRLGERPDVGVGRPVVGRRTQRLADSSSLPVASPLARARGRTRPTGSARPAAGRGAPARTRSDRGTARRTTDPSPRTGTRAPGTALTGSRWPGRAAAGTPGSPAGSSSPGCRSGGRARARYVHPVEQVLCPPQLAAGRAHHRVPGRGDLVQELLEPQLVHLVDRDEQQFVVRGRVGLRCWESRSCGRRR